MKDPCGLNGFGDLERHVCAPGFPGPEHETGASDGQYFVSLKGFPMQVVSSAVPQVPPYSHGVSPVVRAEGWDLFHEDHMRSGPLRKGWQQQHWDRSFILKTAL